MSSQYFLAIDLGSSGARCMVTQISGIPIHKAEGAYSYVPTQHVGELAQEFSHNSLRDLILQLIRESINGSGRPAREIRGIGITGQRQAIALLDKQGKDLFVGPNLDLRSVFQGAALDEAHGQEIYRTTGHLPSFFFALAKLEWFRQHQPDVFGKIARICTLPAWTAYQLTGNLIDEPALLGEAGLLDIRRRQPATTLMKRLGLDSNWIPPLSPAGIPLGTITDKISKVTGVPDGIPVTLAGPDTQAALLGMGAVESGDIGIDTGWSVPVQQIVTRPILDRRRRTWSGCHVVQDRWVVEANSGDAGNAYTWLKNLVDPEEGFLGLERAAETISQGSDGVTAFLGPRALNLSHPGLTEGGILLPVPLTHQRIGKGHLARATMENIAYAIRACVERVETVSGQEAKSVRIGGGMVQNSLLLKILSSVLGRQIVQYSPDASAMAASLAAETAAGYWLSLEEAQKGTFYHPTLIEPDALQKSEYNDHYYRWIRTMYRLDNIWSSME